MHDFIIPALLIAILVFTMGVVILVTKCRKKEDIENEMPGGENNTEVSDDKDNKREKPTAIQILLGMCFGICLGMPFVHRFGPISIAFGIFFGVIVGILIEW